MSLNRRWLEYRAWRAGAMPREYAPTYAALGWLATEGEPVAEAVERLEATLLAMAGGG